MIRIAVDAMGGDRGPEVVVEGALAARTDGIEPVLFGSAEEISRSTGFTVTRSAPSDVDDLFAGSSP